MNFKLNKANSTKGWGRSIITVVLGMFPFFVILSSCHRDSNSPGWEYMPDMYRSPDYETNSPNPNFADSSSNRKPVMGTISRGAYPYESNILNDMPYPYPNTNEGYEEAGAKLKNPIPHTDKVVADGKVMFNKYCIHCHGESGKGDGSLTKNGKFPNPPSYSGPLKDLPEGKMFHTLTYGKNMMGSHASQLTKEERWKIIQYVQTLQKL